MTPDWALVVWALVLWDVKCEVTKSGSMRTAHVSVNRRQPGSNHHLVALPRSRHVIWAFFPITSHQ